MSQAKKHKVPRIKLTQKTMGIYVSARTTINHIAYLMPISPGKTAQALGIVFSSAKSISLMTSQWAPSCLRILYR